VYASWFRQSQCEEYYENGKHKPRIESSREDVIVSHPPAEVEATNNEVENKAPKYPRDVIETGCGRHCSKTGEEDGNIDVSIKGQQETTSKEVKGNGRENADEEEPQQRRVKRAWTEEATRSDGSPNDRGSPKGI